MACTFEYLNKFFKNEFELDDYLLKERELARYGIDIALSNAPLNSLILSKKIQLMNEANHRTLENMRKNAPAVYTEFGQELSEIDSYIGVTKYLSLISKPGTVDTPLMAQFIADNYFNERYKRWAENDYTDNEKRILFLNGETQAVSIKYNEKGRVEVTDELKAFRHNIEENWKALGLSGTAVHKGLELFFSTDSNGRQIWKLSNSEQVAYIKQWLANIPAKESSNEAIYLAILGDATLLNNVLSVARLIRDKIYSMPEYGQDFMAFSEVAITDPANEKTADGKSNLIGVIDLLIYDKNGEHPLIIDYKTSISESWDAKNSKYRVDANKLAYLYQISMYARMLLRNGLASSMPKTYLAPIKLTGFDFDLDKKKIKLESIALRNAQEVLSQVVLDETKNNYLDAFLPARNLEINISTLDMIAKVNEMMKKFFCSVKRNESISKEQLKLDIKDAGGFEKNENGKYIYKLHGAAKEFIADTEVALLKQVYDFYLRIPRNRARLVEQTIDAFNEAAQMGGIYNVENLPALRHGFEGESVNWFANILNLYCNGHWKILNTKELKALNEFGIIILKNTSNRAVNEIAVLKIDTRDLLHGPYTNKSYKDAEGNEIRGRKNLAGAYQSDMAEARKHNSLALEAIYGNISLMEALLCLNYTTGLKDNCVISNISAVNPYLGQNITASNKELLYNFDLLSKFAKLGYNTITNSNQAENYRFASLYETACWKLRDITLDSLNEKINFRSKYAGFLRCQNPMDRNIENNEDKLEALIELKETIEKEFKNQNIKNSAFENFEAKSRDQVVLVYNAVLLAIAETNNINFRQQLRDHDNWLESGMIWRDGISSNYADNPGNLSSETLNLMTKMAMQANQNTRDAISRERNKIKKLIDALKEEKSFTKLKERTVGNMVKDLYADMIEIRNNDLYIKRIDNITGRATKEFAKYFLERVNERRYGKDKAMELLAENSDRYFMLPLHQGGVQEVASAESLMAAVTKKIAFLHPKVAWERARQKMEGVLESEKSYRQLLESSLNLFEMANQFDMSNDVDGKLRERMLTKHGTTYFEQDLETLLLQHETAFELLENMNKVFPIIQASVIHLRNLAGQLNTEFKDDEKYLIEYIKNKILNQSIISDKLKIASLVMKLLQAFASVLTLGFSPVLFTYQMTQGLWIDIKVGLSDRNEEKKFTLKHFLKASKLVYADLFADSEELTIPSGINMLYGLNDMDMNTYAELISSNRHGIFNIGRLAFKFASRPDYYNRLVLFCTLMEADGCLDAHYIEDGLLKYDWTKDKRFDIFALGESMKNHPLYEEQKALYYAMAKLFVLEGTRNPDGTLFKMPTDLNKPNALPRAYTTQLAESMKSFADELYGYYTNERKALVQATFLGRMWLQMKTFWSAKKNLYLAKGGVKLQGDIQLLKDANGNLLYYKKTADGHISDEFTTDASETGVKVMQWKGKWSEGIILSLSSLFEDGINPANVIAKYKFFAENDDPEVLRLFKENMTKLACDLFTWGIGGQVIGTMMLQSWLHDWLDEHKRSKDPIDGLMGSGMNMLVKSLKNSFLDFNFVEGIGSPLWEWLPFVFSLLTSKGKIWANAIMGDDDFYDALVNTFNMTKQVKPMFDIAKPDMFRNSRELEL